MINYRIVLVIIRTFLLHETGSKYPSYLRSSSKKIRYLCNFSLKYLFVLNLHISLFYLIRFALLYIFMDVQLSDLRLRLN